MKTIITLFFVSLFIFQNNVYSQNSHNVAYVGDISINENESRKSIRNYYFIEGMKHFDNANYELSVDYFNKNIMDNKIHLQSYFYKAAALKKMKKYDESIATYNEIIRLDGTFYHVYLSTAWIKYELNDMDAALKNLMVYLKQNAHSHEGLYLKAKIFYAKNKMKDALYYLEQAIEIHHSDPNYYILAGKIRLALKSNKLACENFQKVADMNEPIGIEYLSEFCFK